MSASLLALRADTYCRHPIHTTADTVWSETNCYVDVWVEVLHSLGLDPVAGLGFTLSCDFDGSQWSFPKYPPEDLRVLYGLDVNEINIWRGVVDHVEENLAFGNLTTVEADSFFLPDTEGVSYRLDHVKSTIVPNLVDAPRRRLGYFHNAGYFELEGDDFDGVFRLGDYADATALPPYVEQIRRRCDAPPENPQDVVRSLVRRHLSRRPPDNPVARLGAYLLEHVSWLGAQDLEAFHQFAFGTCRQLGATAELAAHLCHWLDADELAGAAEQLRSVATTARTVEMQLARAARGRAVDISESLGRMSSNWSDALDRLVDCYG